MNTKSVTRILILQSYKWIKEPDGLKRIFSDNCLKSYKNIYGDFETNCKS